jgi:hypothetical protein
MSKHDEPAAGSKCAERSQRQAAPESIQGDIDSGTAGQLTHTTEEILAVIIDRNCAEPLDHGEIAR